MSENWPEFSQFPCAEGIRSWLMDRNDGLRLRVWRFVRLGVTKRALAANMGMHESTLNRWLFTEPGIRPPSVLAWEGFDKFLIQLKAEADLDPMALPKDQQQRIQSETASFISAQRIRAKRRSDKRKRVGKKIAKP